MNIEQTSPTEPSVMAMIADAYGVFDPVAPALRESVSPLTALPLMRKREPLSEKSDGTAKLRRRKK